MRIKHTILGRVYSLDISLKIGDRGEVYYEGRVDSLPDLREYAQTRSETLLLLIDSIETTIRISEECNR